MSDEDVLAEFHRVATALGKIPTWAVFESHAHVTRKALTRRFGDLQGTITRYRRWLEVHEPESPMLAILRANLAHAVPVPLANPDNANARPTTWPRTDIVQYGPPINFRGLRHAPINEQGVVYLFGMVSYELGYLVEAIHTSFPDCEAMRFIDARNNRWQRVRVEFEYRSSNFLEDGHDTTRCDVIVCWEQQVRTIAAYRDRYGITGPDPLGPEPSSQGQRLDQQRADAAARRAQATANDNVRRRHGPEQQISSRDLTR